jgi:hypothetical protein
MRSHVKADTLLYDKHVLFQRRLALEQPDRTEYEKPEIMETFEASEVLGTAAGLGSTCA